MNKFLKILLISIVVLFIVVLLVFFLNLYFHDNKDLNDNLTGSASKKLNYDEYLNEQITVLGKFELKEKSCRDSNDCDYDVYFVDNSSVFSNFSVYKNGRPINCFDEYSREPRKYLRITCGVNYIDRTINREKYEQLVLDFDTMKSYGFYFMRNLNDYYLEMS